MKYLVGIISVLVVVVLVGSVMVPIINDSTGGGVEYEDNPDWDGWVRFDLNTSAGAAYNLQMSQDENGIYVENLTTDPRDVQIYDDSTTVDYPTIMYADSNMVVWSVDDTFNVMGKINGGPVFVNAPILDITRDSNGVEVVTDTDTYLFDAPTWAYVPLSQGKYGFYPYNEDRGVEHPANAPTAVLGGGNVGVWAYNDTYRYDGLNLTMTPIVEDGMYYGASWAKPVEPLDPDGITIIPLDPSVIGGGDAGINPVDPIVIDDPFDPGAEPMGLPTPSLTDGDWGFDVISGTNVKIVSYSGGAGDIVIPSTVSSGGVTYTVTQIGKGSYNEVFDNASITGSTITIPDTVDTIGTYAFYNCSGFTGALVIPASVKSIGQSTFQGCTGFTSIEIKGVETLSSPNAFQGCTGFTGDLILPNTLTTMNSYTFGGCTGLTGTLVIPSSVTNLGLRAFQSCAYESIIIASEATPNTGNPMFFQITSVPEVLDLSETVDYSVTYTGLPAGATIYDTIGDCFGFVSVVSTAHGTPGGMGEFSNLIYAIPIVIISALLVAFGAYVIRRDY